MHIKKLTCAAGLLLAAGVVGCNTGDLTNLNTNPNNPTTIQSGPMFTYAARLSAGTFVGNGFDLRQTEFVACEFMKSSQQMGLVVDIGKKGGTREPAHPDIRYRFGGNAIAVEQGKAEEISGQREADNLASPVRQRLVQPHDAVGDIVDAAGQRALIEQHGLRRESFGLTNTIEFV